MFINFEFILAEFSGQLPSDGGAFYHVDTIDSARPHYRKSWPSILHALAIWLKEAGFAKLNKDMGQPGGDSQPTNAPANLYSEEANAERLYLIIGNTLLKCNISAIEICCLIENLIFVFPPLRVGMEVYLDLPLSVCPSVREVC